MTQDASIFVRVDTALGGCVALYWLIFVADMTAFAGRLGELKWGVASGAGEDAGSNELATYSAAAEQEVIVEGTAV